MFCPAILDDGALRCSSCGKLQGDPYLTPDYQEASYSDRLKREGGMVASGK